MIRKDGDKIYKKCTCGTEYDVTDNTREYVCPIDGDIVARVGDLYSFAVSPRRKSSD